MMNIYLHVLRKDIARNGRFISVARSGSLYLGVWCFWNRGWLADRFREHLLDIHEVSQTSFFFLGIPNQLYFLSAGVNVFKSSQRQNLKKSIIEVCSLVHYVKWLCLMDNIFLKAKSVGIIVTTSPVLTQSFY